MIAELWKKCVSKIHNFKEENSENTYILSFTKEDYDWYIDFPNWPFSKHNLMMVCGADTALDKLSGCKGKEEGHITLKVTTHNEEVSIENKISSQEDTVWGNRKPVFNINAGAVYSLNIEDIPEMWLCPVTLFVFGKYPKALEIKKIK